MALFDQPLEVLRTYRPDRDEPADFDDFWSSTLKEARQHDLDAQYVPVDVGLSTVDAFDVRFAGWNGEPISAWFLVPKQRTGALPCVVGMMDDVCPPSTVFAAYNTYAGPKDIRVWPYNVHEQIPHQIAPNLDFLRATIA